MARERLHASRRVPNADLEGAIPSQLVIVGCTVGLSVENYFKCLCAKSVSIDGCCSDESAAMP